MTRLGPAWYPLFLDLRGLPVVVVGGGAVAARKVRGLLRAGARVTVVAREVYAPLARDSRIRTLRRAFYPASLNGARLVFAATDDAALNARIARLARRKRIWANVAAPPEAGDALVPACVRQGRICVAISTGGASAAAARNLRRELSGRLDRAWGVFVDLLEVRRKRIKARVAGAGARRRLLKALGSAHWVAEIRAQGRAAVARKMDALIQKTARKKMRRNGVLE